MLAIRIPEDTGEAARAFLYGWSICMQAMMHMKENDKQQVKAIFEQLIPEANCPEAKALDQALVTYVMHKCDAPEGIGSAVKKGAS